MNFIHINYIYSYITNHKPNANKAKPDANYITLQGFEALKQLGSSESTKIVIPSELQNVTSLLASMKEVVSDKPSKKSK